MYIIYIILYSLLFLSANDDEAGKKRKRKDRKTERPKDQKTIGALDRYTVIPLDRETRWLMYC